MCVCVGGGEGSVNFLLLTVVGEKSMFFLRINWLGNNSAVFGDVMGGQEPRSDSDTHSQKVNENFFRVNQGKKTPKA